jgi:hypothetical protein
VLACVLASSLWALADPASAQLAPGVHVDPGSPAGKEYAIPLEATRRDFGGAPTNPITGKVTSPGGSTSAGSRFAALFGAGIAPAPSSTRRAATHGAGRAGAQPSAGGRLPVVKAGSDVSVTATTAGIVAAVLVAALALAAVLRVRRRTQG